MLFDQTEVVCNNQHANDNEDYIVQSQEQDKNRFWFYCINELERTLKACYPVKHKYSYGNTSNFEKIGYSISTARIWQNLYINIISKIKVHAHDIYTVCGEHE